MAEVLKIGDRYFAVPTETTGRQDDWMLGQCADAGVLGFVGKKLDTEAASLAMMVSLFKSGRRCHVLAGALVEVGESWTAESAEKNAEWFAGLTDREAKAALNDALIPTLTLFFLGAPSFSTPSPSASVAAEAKPEPKKRVRRSTAAAAVGAGAQ